MKPIFICTLLASVLAVSHAEAGRHHPKQDYSGRPGDGIIENVPETAGLTDRPSKQFLCAWSTTDRSDQAAWNEIHRKQVMKWRAAGFAAHYDSTSCH